MALNNTLEGQQFGVFDKIKKVLKIQENCPALNRNSSTPLSDIGRVQAIKGFIIYKAYEYFDSRNGRLEVDLEFLNKRIVELSNLIRDLTEKRNELDILHNEGQISWNDYKEKYNALQNQIETCDLESENLFKQHSKKSCITNISKEIRNFIHALNMIELARFNRETYYNKYL